MKRRPRYRKAAALTLVGADDPSLKRSIAAWLRKTAAFLLKPRNKFAKRFTAGYNVPD